MISSLTTVLRRTAPVPLILLALTPPVAACPICDTDRAAQVRSNLAAELLTPSTLAGMTLPFVLVAAAAAFVHFKRPGEIRVPPHVPPHDD